MTKVYRFLIVSTMLRCPSASATTPTAGEIVSRNFFSGAAHGVGSTVDEPGHRRAVHPFAGGQVGGQPRQLFFDFATSFRPVPRYDRRPMTALSAVLGPLDRGRWWS